MCVSVTLATHCTLTNTHVQVGDRGVCVSVTRYTIHYTLTNTPEQVENCAVGCRHRTIGWLYHYA